MQRGSPLGSPLLHGLRRVRGNVPLATSSAIARISKSLSRDRRENRDAGGWARQFLVRWRFLNNQKSVQFCTEAIPGGVGQSHGIESFQPEFPMASSIAAEEIESLRLLLEKSHAQHADANGYATCKDTNCVEAKLAIAWLTQRLHERANRSFTRNPFSVRSILPQCRHDEAVIDSFRCSQCAWLYQIKNPQTNRVHEQDAYQACRVFEAHDCRDYPVASVAANRDQRSMAREQRSSPN